MKKILIIIVLLTLLFGCIQTTESTADNIIVEPVDENNTVVVDPNNQESDINFVKVIFCEDEPRLLPPHCDFPLDVPVAEEKIYFAMIVNSLTCHEKNISALCNIKAYEGDKLEYEEAGVTAKSYNQECVPDYRRETICKMFLKGSLDENVVRTIDFEAIDMYSQKSVESKGHVVKIIPKKEDSNSTVVLAE